MPGGTAFTSSAVERLAAAGYKDEDSDGFVEILDGEKIEMQLVVVHF